MRMVKSPRISETTFFDKAKVVEVRSRPVWVVILEFWFLWVEELWVHVLRVRIPTGNKSYWGDDAIEVGFHRFYMWTLNEFTTIDRTEKLVKPNPNQKPRRI